MAGVCRGTLNNTMYQTVEDKILSGVCGSFSAFPTDGQAVLFQQPSGVGTGGCQNTFVNGNFLGGSDNSVFIVDTVGVKLLCTSVIPTVTDSGNDIALGINPNDGAAIIFLASLIIQTGFITLTGNRMTDMCLPFYMLPQQTSAPDVFGWAANAQSAHSFTASGCDVPTYGWVNNRQPGSENYKMKSPLVIGNTGSLVGEASFSQVSDADGNCFSALDLAAVAYGGNGCPSTSTTCAASKLNDVNGLVVDVSLVISGYACVTIC